MSQRTYLSGAQKRKLAEGKKKKEEEEKQKIPKISDIFKPSTSKGTTAEAEAEAGVCVEIEMIDIESANQQQVETGINEISIAERILKSYLQMCHNQVFFNQLMNHNSDFLLMLHFGTFAMISKHCNDIGAN